MARLPSHLLLSGHVLFFLFSLPGLFSGSAHPKAFCFKETQHHSWEGFQAMIQGFIEVTKLTETRKASIESVYHKIDVDNV
jgi:hypothetical protein